jgi:hypothetical protein
VHANLGGLFPNKKLLVTKRKNLIEKYEFSISFPFQSYYEYDYMPIKPSKPQFAAPKMTDIPLEVVA